MPTIAKVFKNPKHWTYPYTVGVLTPGETWSILSQHKTKKDAVRAAVKARKFSSAARALGAKG